ncbi:hypothetical protein F8388_022719 [Cannabis sativa]|uniref:RNase H type-1 domain-containing protein n=1 Tax=Cannabis sativa TaxID=3483 RepID=A0A7J6G1Y8_CANSA|nr:hypothetical protein G4B88_008652 [Cannabis sativa]KAF4377003.1 hypothetical protein F8388_022719 [Cannabis sativa]
MGSLLEEVWKARNDLVFRGRKFDIFAVRKAVQLRLEESSLLQGKDIKNFRFRRHDLEVELLAIFWALQMGKEVGNSSIAIFFDAQMVVRALKERSFPPYWEVRRSAKKVLNFDVCNFLYIPRVDNRGAVNVAKKARSKGHFDGVFDKEGPPVVIPNYLV